MQNFKKVLYSASLEAGEIIKKYFGKIFQIESKDIISNLVTEVDKLSEAKIIDIIQKHFPSHSILSEEIGSLEQKSEFKWIIDPIDGTINFAHGVPICAVSIGLEIEEKNVMGVVYNPIANEFFFAEKNSGSYLNDNKIFVSKENNLRKSLLVTGFPYNYSSGKNSPIDVFGKFLNLDIPIRRLGSAALDICWTACGRFDGFWEFSLHPWDTAAGVIILNEAGGKLSDFSDNPYSIYGKQILATNSLIHKQMLDVITI